MTTDQQILIDFCSVQCVNINYVERYRSESTPDGFVLLWKITWSNVDFELRVCQVVKNSELRTSCSVFIVLDRLNYNNEKLPLCLLPAIAETKTTKYKNSIKISSVKFPT